MLCQNCKINEATSHIHSVVNGVVRDFYLCSDCASKMQVKPFPHDDIFDLLSTFLKVGNVGSNNSVKCECCGTSYETISKTGRVGCGNCYKTFIKQLEPALVRLHGRTSHIGKRYDFSDNNDNSNYAQTPRNIEQMQNELKIAIENEQYEKAAVLRDEIKKAKEEQ